MTLRFLILTQYFPPEVGAAQLRLEAIGRELVKAGHEVEVVTALPSYPAGRIFPGYRGRLWQREVVDGITITRVWSYATQRRGAARALSYGTFAGASLAALAARRRPDVLFVESPPLTTAVPAAVMARLWGIPVVFNVADLWPESLRLLGALRPGIVLRAAESLERWAYEEATVVNAVTDGVRASLIERGVAAEKILDLPNGVDTSVYRPVDPDPSLREHLEVESGPIILYAGTHGVAHGMDVALLAARELAKEEVTFVFVGDGSDKARLVHQAAHLGLRNVRFLEPAPPAQIAKLYAIATAGLSTLRSSELFEGTRPVKVLASMACGKPVLYSGAGEGARLVQTAKAGVVTPPEDPVALADAIRLFCRNSDLATTMGASGRSYVMQHLTWDRIVDRWLPQVIERCVRGTKT